MKTKKTEIWFTIGFLAFIKDADFTGKGSYTLDQLWERYLNGIDNDQIVDHELQNHALAAPNFTITSIDINCDNSMTSLEAIEICEQQKKFLREKHNYKTENLHSMFVNNEGEKFLKIYTV